jgi:hypothetical protein
MEAAMWILAPLLLSLAVDGPPVFEGGKLPVVPGPQTPQVPDLAAGPGASRFDLELRARARRSGSLRAVAVPVLPCVVEDQVEMTSGWKAYRVEAPAGAKVKARLRAAHEAWFRVRTVNRWGALEEGMLQNRIPTGNPEASYHNPKQQVSTFYFVVDTAEIGADAEPFRLELTLQ